MEENKLSIVKSRKSHKCDTCGKVITGLQKYFTRKNDLTKHEKIHLGIKEYECLICNNTFASRLSLRVHQRIHNNEKSFECNVCGKFFRQLPTLKRHK